MTLEDLVNVWDHLSAAEAAARAWLDPGPRHGTWHPKAKEQITYLMPLLARALDRLVLEQDVYPVDPLLWDDPPVVPTQRNRRPRGSAL